MAESIAGGEDNIVSQRLLGQLRGIKTFREPTPEEHAGLRLDPGRDPDRGQARYRLGHRPRQPQPQRLHVLSVAAIAQKGQHQFGCKARAAESGRDLEIGQPLDPASGAAI